jgi:hypothetical protein
MFSDTLEVQWVCYLFSAEEVLTGIELTSSSMEASRTMDALVEHTPHASRHWTTHRLVKQNRGTNRQRSTSMLATSSLSMGHPT